MHLNKASTVANTGDGAAAPPPLGRSVKKFQY